MSCWRLQKLLLVTVWFSQPFNDVFSVVHESGSKDCAADNDLATSHAPIDFRGTMNAWSHELKTRAENVAAPSRGMPMPMHGLLDALPLWALFVATLAIAMLSFEGGLWVGRQRS